MSTGADNKTMPVTSEYEEGYERTFGKRERTGADRGLFVLDPATGKLVRPGERTIEPRVHLQTDAGFEGLRATDGTDISSRTKWQSYMDARGLTLASDYTQTW